MMHHAQWIISEKGSKVISSLLLLIASSCILTLKIDFITALPQFFKIAAIEGLTNNTYTLSTESRLTRGARDDLLIDAFHSTKIVKNKSHSGLRAKSSNCGLWHPSIVEPKTCTNEIDHPLVWDALPLNVKQRLFFTTPKSCCFDHFRETENCRVIDKCREFESHTSAASVPRLRSVVKRQLHLDLGNNPAMNLKMSNSYLASQAQSLQKLPSNCGLWHPSVEERGTCTNSAVVDRIWPEAMFTKTHTECCLHFFSTSACNITDECPVLTN